MNNTVCKLDQCTGCMLCVELCPQKAIRMEDSLTAYNAVIVDHCVACGLCRRICQKNNPLPLRKPMKWFQGWADDDRIRMMSSSGGAGAALARAFIKEMQGYVCSCTFADGMFKYDIVNKTEDLWRFAGSKYVKSTPFGVYKKIRELVRDNKVLFIGLPCHVAAVKAYVGDRNAENLFTVDLICHGTPSPKLLQDFLESHGKKLSDIKSISFRNKSVYGISNDMKPMVQPGTVDRYSLAFLCSLCHTDSCYECSYATFSRVSDITIGDSWASDLSAEEQKKGISLLLVQTEKGERLLKKANMTLSDVDIEKAVQANDQLREPSKKTEKHDIFFENYKTGNFDYATYRALPFKCVKQRIKAWFLKLGILR